MHRSNVTGQGPPIRDRDHAQIDGPLHMRRRASMLRHARPIMSREECWLTGIATILNNWESVKT